jgi:hypothetical protein
MTTPNNITLNYTLGASAPTVSSDLKFSLKTPTPSSCAIVYYLEKNGSTILPTNPNFALDITSFAP